FLFALVCLFRGLVLLNACVERVINECGALRGLVVILRQKGKSTTDQLQPTSCRMIVQLAFDVRCLHDVGYFQENGVMRQPLTYQRRKRAKALRILMTVSCARCIE